MPGHWGHTQVVGPQPGAEELGALHTARHCLAWRSCGGRSHSVGLSSTFAIASQRIWK